MKESYYNYKSKNINLILIITILLLLNNCSNHDKIPRVIIITDIQTGSGDPDDTQSLCHLLWYSDRLDIRAIIPEKFGYGEKPGGITTAERVIDKYKEDYLNKKYRFNQSEFISPEKLFNNVLIRERRKAIDVIISEANSSPNYLYVLLWGNMEILSDALKKAPGIANKIRILSIGTNIRSKDSGGNGILNNWNGAGRDEIFNDPQFNNIWWIENDWGYNGMFHGLTYTEGIKGPTGGRPVEILHNLNKNAGELGEEIIACVSTERTPWAKYFRAGDTPTVLYLIDPNNNFDNPAKGSWAGRFIRPFPNSRPNYWTNEISDIDWDFSEPNKTWENAELVNTKSYEYLLQKREEMYSDLINKIEFLYNTN